MSTEKFLRVLEKTHYFAACAARMLETSIIEALFRNLEKDILEVVFGSDALGKCASCCCVGVDGCTRAPLFL